ncbi:MAG: YaiI/YqxD family protein [Acutalibacteraceae bacterium]
MKILIDADGCPVVKKAISVAKQFNIKCVIVCDTSHIFYDDYAEVVIVSKGADSADFAIVNRTEKDDVVITQDYGLAAMCLSKQAFAINQNGMIYNNDNIDSLLFARYTAKKIRNSGGRLKGPRKRTADNDNSFENNFVKLLKKIYK